MIVEISLELETASNNTYAPNNAFTQEHASLNISCV